MIAETQNPMVTVPSTAATWRWCRWCMGLHRFVAVQRRTRAATIPTAAARGFIAGDSHTKHAGAVDSGPQRQSKSSTFLQQLDHGIMSILCGQGCSRVASRGFQRSGGTHVEEHDDRVCLSVGRSHVQCRLTLLVGGVDITAGVHKPPHFLRIVSPSGSKNRRLVCVARRRSMVHEPV